MPEQEYKSRLPELEVRPDDAIIGDQVLCYLKADIDWTEVMTMGNISTLIGRAKSKKTFFMTLLVASIITNKNPQIRCDFDKKRIVIFDTEQGLYHVWRVSKRIKSMVGSWPGTLKLFGLRPLSVRERIQEIENYVYLNDFDLVIIDGIRDLVTDINSAEQATEIVGKLMKWSFDKKMHICTVLHQNKGDDNARGHIGTEIVNKSETVIQVANSKNKKYGIVTSVYTRGHEIKSFQFKIENGLPVIDTDVKNDDEDETLPY